MVIWKLRIWKSYCTTKNLGQEVRMQSHIIHVFKISVPRNEEVLLRVKEQRNILREISKRKANGIGHILCRNCLLQQVIEGKIK
jgi:hypothetical protein